MPTAGGFILAPVHRSNLDTPIAASVTTRPLRYMGKDTLWRSNRFFAWVLSALGGFPVVRGTADREALRRCQVILETGQPLVLFLRAPAGRARSWSSCTTAPPTWPVGPACPSCPSASAAPNGPSPGVAS